MALNRGVTAAVSIGGDGALMVGEDPDRWSPPVGEREERERAGLGVFRVG